MSRFARRRTDDVEVESGERVIAVGRTPSGAPVVVTRLALYLPTRTGEVRRVAWDEVEHAAWEAPLLEVVEEGAAAPARVLLADPGRVPEAVRERVTSAIVVSERVELADARGIGAQITGRRSGDGPGLRWRVTFDHGADPDDPALRAAADRELARIRSWYGP